MCIFRSDGIAHGRARGLLHIHEYAHLSVVKQHTHRIPLFETAPLIRLFLGLVVTIILGCFFFRGYRAKPNQRGRPFVVALCPQPLAGLIEN